MNAVQLGQQPVQRLGDDGEQAVVLDQVQARRELQLLLFLRAGEEARVDRLGWRRAPRGRVGAIMPTEYRLLSTLRTNSSRCDAVRQEPGAGEVVLHHGDLAVGRPSLSNSALPLSMSVNSTFWNFFASV